MGLLDQVLGAAGGRQPRGGRGSGGMSPVVTALMLALAAKAAQQYMARRKEGAPHGEAGGGGLGGLLGGLTGAGGLGALVDQFTKSGHGDLMNSWVGKGQNQPVAPHQLAAALGPDNVAELQRQTGMDREQMLNELSDELPDAVDRLTPQGRVPGPQDLKRQLS